MDKPIPRKGVMDIPYYVAGRSTVETNKKIFKLSSNESAIGPSPRAIQAYEMQLIILHGIRIVIHRACVMNWLNAMI